MTPTQTTSWQPHQEPLRITLRRTILIALAAGAAFAFWSRGRIGWPLATLLMFWISFGGHWVDLWYLAWLRPRLSNQRYVQVVARLATWFVGGVILAFGMAVTAKAFGVPARWPTWWLGGFVFIGVELVAHLALQLRGRASFLNGRG